MDIEASEFPAMRNILTSGVYKQIKQIAVELHTPRRKPDKKRMDILDYAEIFQLFRDWEVAGFAKWETRTRNNCCGAFVPLTADRVAGRTLCCYEAFYVNKAFV